MPRAVTISDRVAGTEVAQSPALDGSRGSKDACEGGGVETGEEEQQGSDRFEPVASEEQADAFECECVQRLGQRKFECLPSVAVRGDACNGNACLATWR